MEEEDEADRLRAYRSRLDQNRLIELAELYAEDEEYSEDDQMEIVEYWNNLQRILINSESSEVRHQFGLEEDEADVFQYRTSNNDIKRDKEAVERSFCELINHVNLTSGLMHNVGWYDLYEERDIRSNPTIGGEVVELGSIRKTIHRMYSSCVLKKMLLLYMVEAKKTEVEVLFDQIPMFTENQSLMTQFNLMNATPDPKNTNIQQVKHFVATNMMLDRLKIRGYELFKPKVIPHYEVVHIEENGRLHPLCAHCNRGRHLHKMPPQCNDVRQWEKDHVFRPLLEEVGTHKINTQAYVKIDKHVYHESTIESYINEKCKYGSIHSALTKNGSSCNRSVVDYFVKNRSDPLVQHAKLHRHAFSFQNGILYIGDRPQFFPYMCDNQGDCEGDECRCKAGQAPKDLISTTYFENVWCDWRSILNQLMGAPTTNDEEGPPHANMEMNTKPRLNRYGRHVCETCNEAHVAGTTCPEFVPAMDVVCNECGMLENDHPNENCEGFCPWRLRSMAYQDIETPYLDKLFFDQDIVDDTVRSWCIALLFGRVLYNCNEKDKWQIFVNILGKGGTGKSMIAELIQMLFERDDIAILNNNAQDKFVEGDLINKRIIIGPEVDHRLHKSFGRTALCAFAAGDWVCATVKGDKSITARQEAHIILISNTAIYEFQDEAGSIHRRKVVIEFLKNILHMDGLYKERLRSEIGAIIMKAAGLYLDLAKKHGTAKFWDVCPDYFRTVRERSRMRTNMIEMCISEKYGLVFNPQAYISVTEFVAKVKDFAQTIMSQRVQLQPWETDRIIAAFTQQRRFVRIETAEKPKPDNNTRLQSTKWIVGVGDAEYFQDSGMEDVVEEERQEVDPAVDRLRIYLDSQASTIVTDDRLTQMLDLVVQKYSSHGSLDDFVNEPEAYVPNDDGDMYT
ncbi:MAG: hypothetical protein CMF52_00015 [Legionellales bacterium]|nr:hypothetical protein [Legionellales bacterium]|tara:strand:+ start:89 stop:2809 length:2721 start_codon:yes stop_codon:yes gene_type:complete